MTKGRLGSRLAEYIGGLTLVGGDRDGKPFEVLPWERRFLLGAFSTMDGDAALSVARGNGKSALVAGIACGLVDPRGPLHGVRRDVVCAASSFSQARVIYEDVLAMLGGRYDLRDRDEWRKQDSQNAATLTHVSSGARIRCIGSDPARAHGLRPALVCMDEPAQLPRNTSDRLLAALRTGLGKVPGSRLIALGTRPDDTAHWFGKMLDGGAAYSQIHAAPMDAPPFRLSTIRRANPSHAALPSLRRRIERERDEAKRDPVMMQTWRSLRLNQGVTDSVEAVLLSVEVWSAAEGDAPARGPCCWGVDLGTNASQSAVAGFWPETGRLEAVAAFPAIPDLRERGLSDGVGRRYVDCAERGELIVAGERAVNVGELLREALRRFGRPVAVASDRWREAELRDGLEAARVPPAAFETRGMGFKDGAEDVRQFRRAFLEGRVSPVVSLLMRSAMAEARLVSDPAGNAKLAKGTEGSRRSLARDDAVAAAILAVALAERRRARKPARRARHVIVA